MIYEWTGQWKIGGGEGFVKATDPPEHLAGQHPVGPAQFDGTSQPGGGASQPGAGRFSFSV